MTVNHVVIKKKIALDKTGVNKMVIVSGYNVWPCLWVGPLMCCWNPLRKHSDNVTVVKILNAMFWPNDTILFMVKFVLSGLNLLTKYSFNNCLSDGVMFWTCWASIHAPSLASVNCCFVSLTGSPHDGHWTASVYMDKCYVMKTKQTSQ